MSETEELSNLLGERVTDGDEADLREHSGDWWPRRFIQERAGNAAYSSGQVVRPESTEDVAKLLTWANDSGTPVVPFGNGSGVCGGISPTQGVVVDLRSMNAISEVDEKSRLVTAQAGVTGPQLRDHLAEQGFTLGHEPQSFEISTVGGWLATRACGQLSARYGGIEDLVAGLEVVLPDGTILPNKPVPRDATGPELRQLFIGSEGSLGVITEATLRVSPLPEGRADAALLFEHMADGVQACSKLAQSGLEPTVVRLYDKDDTALFTRHEDEPLEGNLLLLSFEGERAEDRAKSAKTTLGGSDLGPALVERWWGHRNDAVGEFRNLMKGEGLLGPHGVVDTMEVSGTWSVLRNLYHSMKEELGKNADFVACHLSHIYPDGACLYFTLGSVCSSDEEALKTNETWWEVGMRTCLDSGGSISHHHGIGRLKARWLPDELGPWLGVLRSVKQALDPKGIMNPGVLGL